jgi:acetyl esterase/lipase
MKTKIALLVIATTFVSVTGQTRTWKNIAYANKSSTNKLDVYLPVTGNGPFPLVIMIHGGAFLGGDKNDEASNASYTNTKEYAVASVNYRLCTEALFPAQINDVKAAIRYLRTNASTYSFDPNRFVAWGESAGGALASLAGTSGGVVSLEDFSMGDSTASSSVQAVVDFFGPINFLTMDGQCASLGGICLFQNDAANSPASLLVGGPIQSNQAICNRYNAETYITDDDPPFIIQHGTEDNVVPYLQSQELEEKLLPIIGPEKIRFHLIPGAGHYGSQFFTTANLDSVFASLDQFLSVSSSVAENPAKRNPSETDLSQNYPNPFNPSTEISYALARPGLVTLKVYDEMGVEIKTLINERKPAGSYRVNFNAAGLGSGVYFYQLKAGNFTEKKKMVVIK